MQTGLEAVTDPSWSRQALSKLFRSPSEALHQHTFMQQRVFMNGWLYALKHRHIYSKAPLAEISLSHIFELPEPHSSAMPRITVELTTEEHRALKLLAILENKKLGVVLKESIHQHLLNKGAHDLKVMTTENSAEP